MRNFSGSTLLLLSLVVSFSMYWKGFPRLKRALRSLPHAYTFLPQLGDFDSISVRALKFAMVVKNINNGKVYFVIKENEQDKSVNVIDLQSNCVAIPKCQLKVIQATVPQKRMAPNIIQEHQVYIRQAYENYYLMNSHSLNIVFVAPSYEYDYNKYNKFMAYDYLTIVTNVERLKSINSTLLYLLSDSSNIVELADERAKLIVNSLLPYLLDNLPLPPAMINGVLSTASCLFEGEKNFSFIEYRQEVDTLIIVGDINGSLKLLKCVLIKYGHPSEHVKYIFNGNFMKFNQRSLNCLLALAALKIATPNSIFINFGSTELSVLKKICDNDAYFIIKDILTYLPLGHIINGEIFVVPGGINAEMSIESLNENFNRAVLTTECMTLRNILATGNGHSLTVDNSRDFLRKSRFTQFIRSYGPCIDGDDDNLVTTLHSSPDTASLLVLTSSGQQFDSLSARKTTLQ